MGFLQRLLGKGDDVSGKAPTSGRASASAAAPPTEHAVILTITLTDDAFGTPQERTRLHAIQDELAAAMRRASAGELDGDEFGEGVCTIYSYGSDADRLWDAIAPVLAKHPFPPGSRAVKRYGRADDDRARQEQIDLAWDG